MSVWPILGAAAVMLLVLGIFMAISGGQQRPDSSVFRSRSLSRSGARILAQTRTRQIAVAVVVGAVVWIFSGWPVAGVVVGVIVFAIPFFFGAGKIMVRRIERLEALEEWVRRLADSMSAGSPPVQTISRSVAHAPALIRADVTQLAARLSSPRYNRDQTLREFADAVDDSLGDIVAQALSIAVSTRASAKVPSVLRMLAEEVGDEVRSRRDIEKGRSGPRDEARLIVILFGLVVVGAYLFLPASATAIYGTFAGQVALGILGVVFLGALWHMRVLSLGHQPPRVFVDADKDKKGGG